MSTWNHGIAKGLGVGAVVVCFACVPADPPVDETSDGSSSEEGETSSPTDTGNGPSDPTVDDTGGSMSNTAGMTTSTSEPTTDPTTTGAGVCGDGTVDDGEACDDGVNDGSYGGCMADCSAKGPFCGDSTVDDGDGEACDDGVNDGSYGGCAGDCSAKGPFCGDGTVDDGDGEACDDGNDVDDDECSNACAAPVCGDGIVQAGIGEVCDDGVNDGSYGGCMADCLAKGPFCGDGMLQDGDGEVCDDGNGDNQDGCIGNCTVPASCAEVLAFDPAAFDGVYGLGVMDTQWQAYCDMTTDGGGWTLAAKVSPTDGWQYGSNRWTDANLFQPNQPGYDHQAAKLATWNLVPFTEVHVGMEAPNMPQNNPPTATYVIVDMGMSVNSLFDVFSSNTFAPTAVTKASWSTLVPNASLQDNCDQEGFNNAPNGMAGARVRIGILANNQMDCDSPDSVLGLGIAGMPPQCMNAPFSSVGNQNCDNLAMPVKTQGFGFIFVR